MKQKDIVILKGDGPNYRRNGLLSGAVGVIVSEKPENYSYTTVFIDLKKRKMICRMQVPESDLKKLEKSRIGACSADGIPINAYDCVELIADRTRYVKDGLKTGSRGIVIEEQPSYGYWLVEFSDSVSEVKCISVKGTDLKLIK